MAEGKLGGGGCGLSGGESEMMEGGGGSGRGGSGRGLAGMTAEHAMLVLLLLLNFIFTACEKFHKAQFHFPFPPLPGICPPRDGGATHPR